MSLVDLSTPADMLEAPAPEPCADISVRELLQWLFMPQYTNGSLDDDHKLHMESAAVLIEKLIGRRIDE